MAAPANQTLTLAHTPQFCGEPKPGFVSAEEFISRIEALREGNAWDDAATIREATRGLYGDAHRWYHHAQKLGYGATHAHEVSHRWDFFKEQFRSSFFTVRSLADSDLDWLGFRQHGGQSVGIFLHNTMGSVAQSMDLVQQRVLANYGWAALPRARWVDAEHNWYDALAAPAKAHVQAAAELFADFQRDGMLRETIRFITAKVGTRGATRDKVKDAIAKALRANAELSAIIEQAVAEEATLKAEQRAGDRRGGPSGGANARNRGRQGSNVHGVDATGRPEDNDDDVSAVENQLAATWGGSSSSSSSSDPNAFCLFCLLKGHRIRDCRKHKAYLKEQQERRQGGGNSDGQRKKGKRATKKKDATGSGGGVQAISDADVYPQPPENY
jgi:hypothetical protein